jgi:alpha-D-ribose 1-methylphosphonate 5-triphosphate diphosphatase
VNRPGAALSFDLCRAQVLLPGRGLCVAPLSLAGGEIVSDPVGRHVDLGGFMVLPGIVDAHGDGFEHHLAPRRGVSNDPAEGLIAAEAELAANGITTAVLAQFLSWEGGQRGPDFAARVFAAMRAVAPGLTTDLIPQLRFETHLLDEYATLPARLADWGVGYVVFNDHLPHQRLAAGKRPPRLTGQALKAGRSPEAHLALLQGLHDNGPAVAPALDRLAAVLGAAGVRMGSHDDRTAETRAAWRRRGARIAEFPETAEAAQAARIGGDSIILGAPNVMRGGSQRGNASAGALIGAGLCDALASDYHYPSPRRAVLQLISEGMDFEAAWGLVSDGPARLLGLHDRGRLAPGMRADLVVLEPDTGRVAAVMVAGRFSFLRGAVAARFL